jgi:tetratricopeptide (TPR) repeat protein
MAYFRNAIAQDPCNAAAFAGLADTYLSLPGWSIQAPAIAYRNAENAVARAVDLDHSLPQAHTTLGMLALIRDWNFPVAEREFRRGVELGPNESLAHQGMGIFLATQSRLEDALKEMQRARDLDPLSLDIGMELGLMHYYLREYREAIAEYTKVIDLDSHYSVAHYMLGVTYFVQSDYASAVRELKESSGLVNNREPLAYGLYAAARFRMGDDTAARLVQADIKKRLHHEYISPAGMALFYIGLGQKDRALGWVEQIFRDRLLEALLVNVDPLYDPIRGDRRLLALIGRVNSTAQLAGNRPSAWAGAPATSGN